MVLEGLSPAEGSTQNSTDLIKDATTQSFETDVIAASMQTPVVVDFWAPWCAPCKQLTPMLERVVKGFGGQVKLVKVNVDENAALAGQLQVQTLPMVYAFVAGRPVDAFQGALPEQELRQFVARLTDAGPQNGPDTAQIDQALKKAQAILDDGDPALAAQLYQRILQLDEHNPKAIAGVLRCYLRSDRIDSAKKVLATLPDDVADDEEIKGVVKAIEMIEESSGSLDDIARLEKEVADDEHNHPARFELAMGLYAAGNPEKATEQLLEIVKRDKDWNDQAARKKLLELFTAIGITHPVTIRARKRLSAMYFS